MQKLIAIKRAREIVLAAARPLGSETVAVDNALGRVLAADVRAAGDVPPFACSAMDGYAIAASRRGGRFRVVGESRAGAPAERSAGPHEAIRVSTGATIPAGANAVVRQEDVVANDGTVSLAADVAPGNNIRGAGEDLRAGTTVLTEGTALGPAELGFAVAAGAAQLSVWRQPVVAILCTGDELRAPGELLRPGEVHNSNASMLRALTVRSNACIEDVGRVPDSLSEIQAGLTHALERADVVVLSGGVSVGPHDHVKPALNALGVAERFWGVALQPGKPVWFGEREGKLVFGLPGNPVSSVVTFTLFVRPALAALQRAEVPPAAEGRLDEAVARKSARDQAVRVRLERRDGVTVAIPTGPQGSHLVSSLVGADALALIPAGDGQVPAGAPVALEPLPR